MVGCALLPHAKGGEHEAAVGRHIFAGFRRPGVAREHLAERGEMVGPGVILIAEFAIVPPIAGEQRLRIAVRGDRRRRDDRDVGFRRSRVEGIDAAFRTERG